MDGYLGIKRVGEHAPRLEVDGDYYFRSTGVGGDAAGVRLRFGTTLADFVY